ASFEKTTTGNRWSPTQQPRPIVALVEAKSRRACVGFTQIGVARLPSRMMTSARARYAGYRFPSEIISHAVWLYFRFPLGLRMVEELLALVASSLATKRCGNGRANLASSSLTGSVAGSRAPAINGIWTRLCL